MLAEIIVSVSVRSLLHVAAHIPVVLYLRISELVNCFMWSVNLHAVVCICTVSHVPMSPGSGNIGLAWRLAPES